MRSIAAVSSRSRGDRAGIPTALSAIGGRPLGRDIAAAAVAWLCGAAGEPRLPGGGRVGRLGLLGVASVILRKILEGDPGWGALTRHEFEEAVIRFLTGFRLYLLHGHRS